MHPMLQLGKRGKRYLLAGFRLRGRVGESWDGWLTASSSISRQGYPDEGSSNACDDQPRIRELGKKVTGYGDWKEYMHGIA